MYIGDSLYAKLIYSFHVDEAITETDSRLYWDADCLVESNSEPDSQPDVVSSSYKIEEVVDDIFYINFTTTTGETFFTELKFQGNHLLESTSNGADCTSSKDKTNCLSEVFHYRKI